MIWIIGGTSETRELLNLIDEEVADEKIKPLDSGSIMDNRIPNSSMFNKSIVVTVATEEGKKINSEFIDSKSNNIEILVGRMNLEEMQKFIEENKIETVIDLSHPYAVEVSKNAKKAAKNNGCRYIRFVRNEIDTSIASDIYVDSDIDAYETETLNSIMIFNNIEKLKEYLSKIEGTVFFTTGSKDIPEFESVRKNNRFIYRILPAEQGIKICSENGVALKDIIGVMGPFSKEFNKSMFENYNADYVVMKNSGESGGTSEKIEACKELSIKALVIGRPEDDGVSSLAEIMELIK